MANSADDTTELVDRTTVDEAEKDLSDLHIADIHKSVTVSNVFQDKTDEHADTGESDSVFSDTKSSQSLESSDTTKARAASETDDQQPMLKSATVCNASPTTDTHLFSKSQSSPDLLGPVGYQSQFEKMLAVHMDVTRVLDRFYLSDFISLSAARLAELGITLVINAAREIPNTEVEDGTVEFMRLNVDDVPTADLTQFMDTCADRIHEVRSAGGAALVHCALGISRSVSICLAYLIKHEGRTLREAYFEVKKKRPIIRPNEGFWRQLINFETGKRGRATVKLSVYPMGVIPDVYQGAPRTRTTRRYAVLALFSSFLICRILIFFGLL